MQSLDRTRGASEDAHLFSYLDEGRKRKKIGKDGRIVVVSVNG